MLFLFDYGNDIGISKEAKRKMLVFCYCVCICLVETDLKVFGGSYIVEFVLFYNCVGVISLNAAFD